MSPELTYSNNRLCSLKIGHAFFLALKYVFERCDLFLSSKLLVLVKPVFRKGTRVHALWCARFAKKKTVALRAEEKKEDELEMAKRHWSSPQIRFWTKWQLDRTDHRAVLMGAKRNVSLEEWASYRKLYLFINFNEIIKVTRFDRWTMRLW